MKIQRTKEWWLAKARRERETVGAGLLALDPAPQTPSHVETNRSGALNVDETRFAFGRLVQLMRRHRGLSIEELADRAALDMGDLVSIEEDLNYMPEPRTIYQLARTFDLPQQGLMELSGLVVANDAAFRQAAIRFAARSESSQKLSPEEKAALSAFVEVLSRRSDLKKTP